MQERRWRVCYDRKRHQASLYHNGTLHNSWLVRGGATTARPVSVTSRSSGGARTTRAAPTTARRCPTPSSSGGQALHGSRNMMNPYVGHSHGCVNFWVEDARQAWNLTHDKKLYVHVYGAWD